MADTPTSSDALLRNAQIDALMVKPSAEAMERSPVTANSRPMMMTMAQAGAMRFSTSEMSAAEISNLSAMGSSRMPSVETWPRLRAR